MARPTSPGCWPAGASAPAGIDLAGADANAQAQAQLGGLILHLKSGANRQLGIALTRTRHAKDGEKTITHDACDMTAKAVQNVLACSDKALHQGHLSVDRRPERGREALGWRRHTGP